MKFGKMEIANLLAALNGFGKFLEISTGTTGNEFASVDATQFATVHRLAYNVRADFDDGSPIEWRSETFDIDECVAEMERRGACYDIILVDPYHDYSCSRRDIEIAYRFLNDTGAIIVHDCLPPSNGDLISPTYVPGAWCGVTFIAYIDFLMEKLPRFVTIDCDYGCGIIRKSAGDGDPFADLRDDWSNARLEQEKAFRFLSDHKTALLNLRGPYQFEDKNEQISQLTDQLLDRGRQLVAADSSLRRLTTEIEDRDRQLVAADSSLRRLTTEIEDRDRQLVAADSSLRRLTTEIEDRDRQLVAADRDMQRLTSEAADVAEHLAEVERRLQSIETSTSWRIMKTIHKVLPKHKFFPNWN